MIFQLMIVLEEKKLENVRPSQKFFFPILCLKNILVEQFLLS